MNKYTLIFKYFASEETDILSITGHNMRLHTAQLRKYYTH